MMTMTRMGMRVIEELDLSRLDGNISLHGTAFGTKDWKYDLTQGLSRNGLEYVVLFLRYVEAV